MSDSSVEVQAKNPVDDVKVEVISPIGELTIGRGSVDAKFLLTALSILNNPHLNYFLLVNKVKLRDRLTGTVIFPREGMLLPGNKFYKAPKPISEEQSNAS